MAGRDFGEVTTKELASKANIAEATLFRYFPRKEEVLAAIVEEKGRVFFEEFGAILEVISNPVERLMAFCRHHALFAFEHKQLIWLLEREITFERPTAETLLKPLRCFLATIEELLEEGVATGHFRNGLDRRSTAMAFHGSIRNLLLEERVYGKPIKSLKKFLEFSDRHVGILLDGILSKGGLD
jgi:TetR/AcrR family fatty acid metabolism transcriptional regulator